MKKIVSILVVLAMLASMVPAVFAAESVSGTVEAAKGKTYTTETWTADADGVLTITLSSDNGLGYKTYIDGEAQSLGWEGYCYSTEVSYDVTAGTEVYLELAGKTTGWGNTDSTISYSFSFAGGAVKEAYTISEQTITTVGTYPVEMIQTAEVTIVTVTPDETGVYTITVGEDALVGNYGSGSWWIFNQADVEHGTSLEWTCQQAGHWETVEIPSENWSENNKEYITVDQYVEGQSLMLGIVSDSDKVDVTITKTADYEANEVELTTYVNSSDVSQFTIPEGATVGDYVDVTTDTTHTAVLGDDGYYHLDSADGDILLVDMDYKFRLSEALEGGRGIMYAYVTDENGKTIEKWDIGAAVKEYEAACDDNGYYPLTADLIFFYDDYAGSNGVYSYALGETYNAECAWMYACLTMALPEEELGGSGTEEDPYIITSLPYDMAASFKNDNQAEAGIYYQYTADKDGSIEIKDVSDDFNTGTLSVVTDEGWTMINEGGYGVKQGDVILLCHWAIWAGDYDLTLQYAEETSGGGSEEGGDEGEEGGDTGEDEGGSDEIQTVTEETVWTGVDEAVTPDAPIEITFIAGVNGTVTVKDLSGADTGWEFYISSEESNIDSRLSSDEIANNGDSKTETLVAGSLCTITICAYDETEWVWLDGKVSYTVEFIPSGESGEDEPVAEGTLVDGNNTIELPAAADAVAYTYTATETGTLYIIATYIGWDSDGSGVYDDDTAYIADNFAYYAVLDVNGTPLEKAYYGSVEVVAGETYTFTWTDSNEWNSGWGWEATLNLSYSDELIPVAGTADLPIEIYVDECPTDSIEIAAGESAYYLLCDFDGANFTIEGEDVYAVITSEVWNYETFEVETVETIYNAVNGVVTIPVTGYYVTVQICNGGESAATYALDYNYPEGSYMNPAELVEGDTVVKLAEENAGYYFTWVAQCNGTLTISVEGDYWQYCVTNYGADMEDYEGDVYGDWHLYADDPAVPSETWEVKAGDILLITVATYDIENYSVPAGTVTMNADIEYAHEPDGEGEHSDVTCTEDGTVTYTCSICGETYVVVEEEAPGHNFVDGECTVCGEPEVMLGDVNGDGKINMFDAAKVVSYYTGKSTLTDAELAAADVNGDGKINMFDAAKIVAMYTGK